MTFPTKEDIEFFSQPEVRRFFGKRWEPRFGDFVFNSRLGVDVLPKSWGALAEDDVWLPRADQLIEMLEEKGCFVETSGPFADEKERHLAKVYRGVGDPIIERGGSTPAIALAKCVMEIG